MDSFSDSDSEMILPKSVKNMHFEKLKFQNITTNDATKTTDIHHLHIANSTAISETNEPPHNHVHSHSANISDSVISDTSTMNILPHCRRNLRTSETTKTIDKTKAGRKWTKRNFTNDGKFDTDIRRTGHDLAGALYRRGTTLINKAKELHNVTNAQISLTIKPLTDRGQVQQFTSPNFNDTDQTKVTMKRNRHLNDDNPTNKTDACNDLTVPYGFDQNDSRYVAFEKKKVCTPKKKITKSGACAYPPVVKKPGDGIDSNTCQICKIT